MTKTQYASLLRHKIRKWLSEGRYSVIDLARAALRRDEDRGYGLGEETVALIVDEEVTDFTNKLH